MKITVLALLTGFLILLGNAGAAQAGAGPAWQTVSAAGSQIQAPSGWTARPSSNPSSSLQQAIVAPDAEERVSVYVTPLQISPADLPLFVSTYLGNQALGAPTLGQPQAATVSGAGTAATMTATYTDAGGAHVSDTVVAAMTASQLYVLEILTPAAYAQDNAAVIQTIVQSFAIAAS